ncbi:MAG TPA: hypothetical protein P5161_03770 [Eubacteriales bacterium]|jgi:hypothetical protein|nr:hypothetical protein [Clostridia bacterium]HRR89876.1 hypothetical protein [Eubacteriales bacterium]HRU84152.1 hypothetical protein [Eubacteriales bacterium]
MEKKTGRGLNAMYVISLILLIPFLTLGIYLCIQRLEAKRMGGTATMYGLTVVDVIDPVDLLGQKYNGYNKVIVKEFNTHDLKKGDLVAYYSIVDNPRQTSQVRFARIDSIRTYNGGLQLHMSDMASPFHYTDHTAVIGKFLDTGRAAIFFLDAVTSDLGVALIAVVPMFVIMIIQIAAYVAVAKEKEGAVTSTDLILYDMNQTALVFDDDWQPGQQTGPTLALQSAEQARREQFRRQQEMMQQRMQQQQQQGAPKQPK